MALDNGNSSVDMSLPCHQLTTTEKLEKQLMNVNQDTDPITTNINLTRDAAPSLEKQSPEKSTVQISAVPNTINLFEMLIKRAAITSEKAVISREEPTVIKTGKDVVEVQQESQPDNMERTNNVNGHGTAVITNNNIMASNGKSNAEEHEISSSDMVSNDNQSPGRSIFDNLRKNFHLSNETVPTKADGISINAEVVPMQTNQVEITSSSGRTTFVQHQPSNGEVILINDDDDDESSQSTVRDDNRVFPFTQRLKWMSQQSREGSPSLPQQPEQPPSYHGNHIATNQISSESVIAERTGYTPLYGQSVQSSSGPGSVHLHNGRLGNVSLCRNDVYLVLDPQTKFVKGNFSEPPQTGQYILQAEQFTPSQQAPFPVSSGFSHDTMQTFPHGHAYSENMISTNHNVLYSGSPLIRKEGPSLHSRQSHPLSSVWESRPVVTSPVHRTHFSYANETSAFSSPAVNYQSLGVPSVIDAHNGQRFHSRELSFQPTRLETKPREEFAKSNSYKAPMNVVQHSLTCNERFPNSSEHFSISDRVFRPVSPSWNHALHSNALDSSPNNSSTRSRGTVTDVDKDEYSYACALYESANSPDIERMLGSESPVERLSISSPPPLIESQNNKTEAKINSIAYSDVVRELSSISDSTPTITRHSSVNSEQENHSCDNETNDESSNSQSSDNNNSSEEPKKKKKVNLNVIHKRLEPKLPSPVREITSGDLYQDPSKLTREERALQRAMMMFSEMEMKEKVVLPKKRRDVKADEPQISTGSTTVESTAMKTMSDKSTVKSTTLESTRNRSIEVKPTTVESTEVQSGEKKLASSTWLLNVKRKKKKLMKKNKKEVKKITVHDVEAEPLNDPRIQTEVITHDTTETKMRTKIKKRKRNKDDNDKLIAKKKKKFMNEARKKLINKVVKTTEHQVDINQDHNPAKTSEEIPIKEKKLKKFKLKRRLEEKHRKSKHVKKDFSTDPSTVTSGNQNMSEPSFAERKRNTEEKPIVKTYMLVPSYQGFKDFQPIVIESRTRRKGTTPQRQPDKVDTKSKVPLLVVESVHSKPIKEMVVAENEQVQKLVTECLRIHGKWHGDELEQALKREEAELKEEVTRLRDAKKLSVNRTTGETILHKAARLGYDEIVKQCILQGADPNAKDNAGWTPLHEACARGKLAVVKVLTRYGADVNSQSNDGIRPIHDAAEAGHVDVIRVLLSYGADPFLVTYSGLNAMACGKHPRIKAFLQEYCIDVGCPLPDLPGQTDTWEFSGSITDGCPGNETGIWDGIPDCSQSFFPEFEISDKPHINTYNLPVIKDDVIVGRRNYMLLQEIYDNSHVAKTTLQKKLKSVEMLELPWHKFLEYISENQVCVKPSFTPEGTSTDEPIAQLIPLNYTMRRLLNIRIEANRFL